MAWCVCHSLAACRYAVVAGGCDWPIQ